ncbi:autotransporter domain-containing protein [Pseudomonas kairouanensis]|uniref:Autotransporter domain-containing protein n=1 Tax=Pseudomonas kairouanensis TaxID=2293832 RepID=A0A4Z0ASY7_9PSED|nr:autotransporter outer membrane beta-barrel domain-containing protein [Pseudomonas kairouanensis]TFY89500.1 autotransporter domain-containing protein [Pseudomonas kairouanensis]
MPFPFKQLVRAITLVGGVASAQLTQAQQGSPFQFSMELPSYSYGRYEPIVKGAPIDGYLYNKATTPNGRQVAKVLEPALSRLLESGGLTSEQIKTLEKFADQLAQAPGGMGAALEQLAGSQNANLAGATQNTTQHIGNQLLSTLRTLPDDDHGHFWVQNLGNDGTQSGSTGLKYGTQGLLLGADWALGHNWRAGVMGAKTTTKLDAHRFAGELDSWHLGGYAVRQDGPLALRLGAIYSNHGGQNKRNVELFDYKEQLRGKYSAQSQTLFSELGYQWGNDAFSVEPFAGLGYQRYQRDSFKEQGGLTALNVGPQTQQNLSSTFGVRLATVYHFNNRMSVSPHLSTGWKHLYADVDSRVRQSFRYSPVSVNDFTVNGTALDRNSLNWRAGVDLELLPLHTVGLTYSGDSGTRSSNQGLMGEWRMRF